MLLLAGLGLSPSANFSLEGMAHLSQDDVTTQLVLRATLGCVVGLFLGFSFGQDSERQPFWAIVGAAMGAFASLISFTLQGWMSL